jgi:hypothetical protein
MPVLRVYVTITIGNIGTLFTKLAIINQPILLTVLWHNWFSWYCAVMQIGLYDKSILKKLCCSVVDCNYRAVFVNKFLVPTLLKSITLLDIEAVIYAIHKQKRGKAPGPDGIHMETFTFGCCQLCLCRVS